MIAKAPARGASEEVEEVEIVALAEFVEAPVDSSREVAALASDDSQMGALESGPPGLLEMLPDVGEQAVLIRRMLALYERMNERR